MKTSKFLPVLALTLLIGFTSCSKESLSEEDNYLNLEIVPETKQIEIEILNLINEYRTSIGLNSLQTNSNVKAVAFTHTDYMIEVNDISHDNFYLRKVSLETNENAKAVFENVAYGYNSPEALVEAWLNSPGHRSTIEGVFTHFDISAEQDENGRWYYTNIFIER